MKVTYRALRGQFAILSVLCLFAGTESVADDSDNFYYAASAAPVAGVAVKLGQNGSLFNILTVSPTHGDGRPLWLVSTPNRAHGFVVSQGNATGFTTFDDALYAARQVLALLCGASVERQGYDSSFAALICGRDQSLGTGTKEFRGGAALKWTPSNNPSCAGAQVMQMDQVINDALARSALVRSAARYYPRLYDPIF